ncbi:phage tail protein [Proteus terrae]|uniref:phage tail protein n=1 Tax=Proteus terrae TaxID=1574161 RepID=UPI001F36C5A8|nr:phage tail protein [Proteus terrae]
MKNPKLISKPFAQNGQKNVIPEKYETSMESNQATWDQGFGQITMLPVSAGGLPPKGQDFNGILNQMCETIVHISKGGVFKFSADYATAINGYPKGAILQSEDEEKYYQSLIDNNKVNFNTASQDQIKASWKLVMTDNLLDQLSKKLESSAVVQSTGASTTSVMSQRASTDAFQPKGTYPTTSEMNVELNKKVDKASISQQLANDVNKVPSLDLVTKELGKKQPVGNYADKSSGESQRFAGQLVSDKGLYSRNKEKPDTYFGLLEVTNGKPFGIYCSYDNEGYVIDIPEKVNGKLSLVGDSYTKSDSDSKYQPKGNYAPAGNYADKSSPDNQRFSGSITAKTQVSCTVNNTGAGLLYDGIIYRRKDNDYAYINIPEQSGKMALISDVESANNIPVGSPIPWSLPTAPSGYLICQGQTFNKATYPKLAIAYPSGRLPELRGEFIRGADAGRGIDVGREILSNQSGNSLLSTNLMEGDAPDFKQYKKVVEWIGNTGTNSSSGYGIWQQIEGQNGNETHPRNIAFLYIVRAA